MWLGCDLESRELCLLTIGMKGASPGTTSVVSPTRALGAFARREGPLVCARGGDCTFPDDAQDHSGDIRPFDMVLMIPRAGDVKGCLRSLFLQDSISSSLIGDTPRLKCFRFRIRQMRNTTNTTRMIAIDPRIVDKTMTKVW